jgi:hypothetical protein
MSEERLFRSLVDFPRNDGEALKPMPVFGFLPYNLNPPDFDDNTS